VIVRERDSGGREKGSKKEAALMGKGRGLKRGEIKKG